ncbi:MAG: hypothetical protein A2073_01320 [Deltaproteobacteria bacterium GWC2_42_11]|nr:MAG: hypothetical protein A2073_01320 [Deltaproteobacteria bacterium GWC2_42_11]HBO84649.1 hypothetical protein [Deltaproteobacteria bacterium]
MRYFKVTMEYGHMGAGNGIDVTRYFVAKDAVSLLDKVKRLPGIKWRQGKGRAIKAIEVINKEKYLSGKMDELKNPYLLRRDSMKSSKRFRCPLCGKEFSAFIALKKHIKKVKQTLGASCPAHLNFQRS